MPIRELFPTQIEWFFLLLLLFCTVLSLILFTWQHTSAFQMSKQTSSQLGSTDAEHLVRSVGLEEPGQGGSAAPQRQQEQAGTLWDGIPPETGKSTTRLHSSRRAHPGGPMTEKPTGSYVTTGHTIYVPKATDGPALSYPILGWTHPLLLSQPSC